MEWEEVVYATAGPCVGLVAVYALVLAWREHRQARNKETVDHFISARGSASAGLLAFSFFASSMGSWAATAPASYAAVSGLLGLSVYSVSVGLPILFIARVGNWATKTYPEATSLSHFLQWRFTVEGDTVSGRPVAGAAVCVMLFNMIVALLAEYVTIGALFRDFVGVTPLLPVLTISLLTMAYTAAGGLFVSILTDRIQAIATLLLALGLAIYLSSTFSPPSGGLPPLSQEQAGFSYEGYSSLFSMPVSLIGACLFSEAVWQRVWAAENSKALYQGAFMGCISIVVVVFFFGFVGFLSLWAQRATSKTNSNLYFFSIFNDSGGSSPSVLLSNWFGVLAIMCTCVMSEGAIDSYQNAIVATVSSNFFRARPLWMTRALVVLVNVPLVVMATTDYVTSVLSLFLMTNLLCTCWLIPLILCLSSHEAIRSLLTEASALFGGLAGMLALCILGWSRTNTASDGLYLAWLGNDYGVEWFAVALGGSAIGVLWGISIRVVRGYCGFTRETNTGRAKWVRNMLVGSPFDKDIDDAPLLKQAQFVEQFGTFPMRSPSSPRTPLRSLPGSPVNSQKPPSRASSM